MPLRHHVLSQKSKFFIFYIPLSNASQNIKMTSQESFTSILALTYPCVAIRKKTRHFHFDTLNSKNIATVFKSSSTINISPSWRQSFISLAFIWIMWFRILVSLFLQFAKYGSRTDTIYPEVVTTIICLTRGLGLWRLQDRRKKLKLFVFCM